MILEKKERKKTVAARAQQETYRGPSPLYVLSFTAMGNGCATPFEEKKKEGEQRYIVKCAPTSASSPRLLCGITVKLSAPDREGI